MQPRTDLAAEAAALAHASIGVLDGVVSHERTIEGIHITDVEILNDEAANAVGKPRGRYITLDIGRDTAVSVGDGTDTPALGVLAAALRELVPPQGGVLVAGLGNRAVTPDALGPLAAERVRVTRHLRREIPQYFGMFREVASVSTGVAGTTGLDSVELIAGAVERMKPACVLAIDALASRSASRVFASVQLCNSGIAPGSGVGNERAALCYETLGVPVIAVGVPTVVDAATLAFDLAGGEPDADTAAMFVTPRDVDVQIDSLASLIASAINIALGTE